MPEEKEEREVKEKAKERKSRWASIPTNLKVGALIFVGLILYQSQKTGKPIQWQWILLVAAILYLLSQEQKEIEEMNESTARRLVKSKIKELIKLGDIPKGTDCWVSKNVDLKHFKANPSFYLFGLQFRYPNGRYEYNQAKVDFKSWDVRLMESVGKIRGDEIILEKPIIPDFAKTLKDYPDLGKTEILRWMFK